jgi:glycerol-3-phosphate cytidylyltransferase|tara:strand:+ start:326 stop:760 length:435 start_codon:yes stop_codon:yes gene_type:complete
MSKGDKTRKAHIRGFTCGSFDLLHAGHILMLKEIKSQCHYLIVGLQSDPSIDRNNKNSPIQSVEERRIQLDAVKYVDQIIEYDTEEELVNLLDEIRPEIRFVGADWEGNPNLTGVDLPIKIVYNTRDHNYSTTELRNRIFKSNK